ncbi:hypothetical protein HERIO_1129 [Hepatospora eriocheir]|uniref:Uncharacterized protein n=1 Tax=Hepatospora eriocheir TaxID=1081669 RepID=A0A1X0QBA0_9MICR|nr:hypothetical protein HERIO_1129 [Hepatospora eriocheir]
MNSQSKEKEHVKDEISNISDLICKHVELDHGYCIDCGLDIKGDELIWDKINHNTNLPKQITKFSVIDPKIRTLKMLKLILTPLNQTTYKNEILEIIHTKQFVGKISLQVKITIILFDLLKRDNIPVTVDDLVKYACVNRFKLLKHYRNNFHFKPKSDEFYEMIIKRAKVFIKTTFNIDLKETPPSMLEMFRNNQTCEPFKFAIVTLLIYSKSNDSKVVNFLNVLYHLKCKIKRQIDD